MQLNISPVFETIFDPQYSFVDKWYLYGGRDSGKSVHAAIKQLLAAIDRSMQLKTGRILACRSIQNNIENSVLAELKNACSLYPEIAKKFNIGQKYLRTKDNRVSFAFEGTNINPIGLKGISNVFLGVVDEADAMTQAALDFFEPTIRAEDGKIFYIFNPTTKSTPLAKKFLRDIDGVAGQDAEQNLYKSFIDKNQRIGVIFSTYKENQFLSMASARRILHEEKKMEEDDFNNIYGGRFINVNKAAYYSKQLAIAYQDGRITELEYNQNYPVYSAWDLGMNDLTVVVLFQIIRNNSTNEDNIFIVECFFGNGQPIDFYAEKMLSEGFGAAKCYLPHDGAATRGYTTTETAETVLNKMGFETSIVSNQGKAAAMKRIIRLRSIFSQLWFNSKKSGVKFLIESMEKYAPRIVNDIPTDAPDHTFSDACDAAGIIPYALDAEAGYTQFNRKDNIYNFNSSKGSMAF